MTDYKALYEAQIEELEEELRIYKTIRDEFSDVFVRVGELVENTNLPRHGEQLVIEFSKLKEQVERLEEENKELKQKKTKSVKRKKYIHYKNLVLKHELDDVSDFEDEDYPGFGEKPYSK